MGLFGTSAGLFADISLVLEAIILGSFLIGWRYAKNNLTNEHYRIMTGAFALNLVFVGGYMIRSLITEGSICPCRIHSLLWLFPYCSEKKEVVYKIL
jgi:uncharacterized membrane protein YozB (DUF420 family)